MGKLRTLWSRVKGQATQMREDEAFGEEVHEHIALLEKRYQAQGMSIGEAAHAARRQFGNVTVLKERQRAQRGMLSPAEWGRDVRFGMRMLAKRPALNAAMRPRRRPARPPAAVHRRGSAVLARVAAEWRRAVIGDANRRPRPAGPRRRARLPRRDVDHHDDLHRQRRAHAGALGVWSAIAAGGRGGRAAARRRAYRPRLVAVDLHRQRPGRRSDRAARDPLRSRVRAQHVHRAFDLAGAATVTGGLVVLVYGIVKAQAWGWGSGQTIGFMAAGIALLAAFVLIERRSAAPLVRLDIFRVRSLADGGRCATAASARRCSGCSVRLAVRAGHPPLQPAAGRVRVPPGDGRDHHRLCPLPAADQAVWAPRRRSRGVRARGGRHGAPHRRHRPRQLRQRPAQRAAAAQHRHRADVRADHAARDRRRRLRRCGTRLRAVQHLAAGWRLAGARAAVDVRGEPARRACSMAAWALRLPGCPATTSRSRSRPGC